MSISAYTSLSNKEESSEFSSQTESPTEGIYFLQLKSDWQRNPVTAKLFLELRNDIDSMEKQARDLAHGYASNENHLQIVILLNRAAELRKVVEKYAQ